MPGVRLAKNSVWPEGPDPTEALQRSAPAKYWPFVNFVFSNQEAINAKNVEAKIKEFLAEEAQALKLAETVPPARVFDFTLQRAVNKELGIKG